MYGVPVLGVRSYIQLQKLRQDKPGVERVAPRRWFRPRSIKKMTVEMERAFVWPEELKGEELERWVILSCACFCLFLSFLSGGCEWGRVL